MRTGYKYYIDKERKIPLKPLCDNSNISYNQVVELIYKLSRQMEYSGRESYEITRIAYETVKRQCNISTTYYDYIISICNDKDLDSEVIFRYIDRNFKSATSEKELVDKAVLYALNHKYFLNGIAVEDICMQKGLNSQRVLKDISREISRHEKVSRETIIMNCIAQASLDTNIRYTIGDKSLVEICREYDLRPAIVIIEYNKLSKDSNTLDESLLKEALDIVKKRVTRSTNNLIDGFPLPYYCEMNDLPYKTIMSLKYGLRIDDKVSSDEDIIRKAIDKYIFIRDNKIDLKPGIFESLMTTTNPSYVCYYCMLLNIDYEKVMELHARGYSFYQAFSIIWFYSDEKVEKTKKLSISDQMIYNASSINTTIDNLYPKKDEEEIEEEDLFNLRLFLAKLSLPVAYRTYKCNMLNKVPNDEIVYNQSRFIDSIIENIIKDDKGSINYSTLLTFKGKIMELLKEAFDSCFYRTNKRINEYITSYVTEGFTSYYNSYMNSIKKTVTPVEEDK